MIFNGGCNSVISELHANLSRLKEPGEVFITYIILLNEAKPHAMNIEFFDTKSITDINAWNNVFPFAQYN